VQPGNGNGTVQDRQNELTLRGILLGAAITLVFTAANVYLGLKVGLTFASSIPAAVISMAILRAFKNGTVQENNIVQTVASAAGTLSSIIFVLPGLVMVGWWTGFPFWETFGVCAVGGILGVMYSVPLRRAMVTTSDLPYPEGVAAAEVLIVGAGTSSAERAEENRTGLLTVVIGALASAAFAIVIATRLFIDEIDTFFRVGPVATGTGFALSLALVGAGHLIGLTVGIAMLGGVFIAWGIATPLLTSMHPVAGAAADVANGVWRHQVRFIGAGAIGISAIWALGRLASPVIRGVAASLAASRRLSQDGAENIPRVERDIPITTVASISLACLLRLALLFALFLSGTPLAGSTVLLVTGAILYVVIAGFLVAAACGYMAGLIGSSNSPVSGLAILAVLGASLLLLVLAKSSNPAVSATLVAYALFVTAVVLCVATIANDNLQDLKTGQLVDATPWRQQVALMIGVIMGAIVIPPILDLLNHAYGFAGSPIVRGAGAALTQPLPAPQATLISALAKGVITGDVPWNLIGIGALAGLAIIALDEGLRARKLAFPPLAVGLGIYLPPGTILPVVVGAVAGHFYNRWSKTRSDVQGTQRLGVLLASGLIVGESLMGVLVAGIIVASGKGAPLALVGDSFGPAANVLGGLAFIAVTTGLYVATARLSKRFGKAA
jgi:putative OPT family oligopeptide transporter